MIADTPRPDRHAVVFNLHVDHGFGRHLTDKTGKGRGVHGCDPSVLDSDARDAVGDDRIEIRCSDRKLVAFCLHHDVGQNGNGVSTFDDTLDVVDNPKDFFFLDPDMHW